MANTDKPCGFYPFGKVLGMKRYEVDASAGTIYEGDLIIMESDGCVVPATAGSTALLGASNDYHLTGTAGSIMVFDNPKQRFVGQCDESNYDAQTDIGTNADLIAGAGNANTLRSGHEIDSSTTATTTAQLRVIELAPRANNALGSYARLIVEINEHFYKRATGV